MTYFDERARDWDSDPTRVERARVVADAMRAALPLTPGTTALEYGCGTGLLSFALQSDFASITLADTSQGMLDVLADKIKSSGMDNFHPVRLDLASQPLPVFRFDVIYSLMTMHHLPETKKILRNFHDILNPGGYLVIADLEKEDGSFHGPEVKDVHLGFDREDLRKQIDSAGFFKIKFSTVFDVKKTVDGHEKSFPLFLMVAKKKALAR
ncbi:MAG TPA: class I SAM-dependent methyltransferase [Anaerolineales bacterium]|jgi:ubiquinone/menaquinone biosynthesis C-methylase UbiE